MKIPAEVNPLQKAMIENMYKSFTKSCLARTDSPSVIKRNLMQVNSTYQKFGMGDVFCSQTDNLCSHLLKKGNFNLANIILDELGKICMKLGKTDMAERVIEKSMTISSLVNDEIHVLSRLNDLEFLYKRNCNTQKLTGTLNRKIKSCEKILSNYNKHAQRFISISKKPTDKSAVQVQLAFAYSDLADVIFRTNPVESVELIKKARKIYQTLGQKAEENYLTKKIQIMQRKIR